MKYILFLMMISFELNAFIGKVYAIKGNGTLIRGSEKKVIALGTTIEEKDTLVTSKNTKIQIVFSDKTVVTLGRYTNFFIEEYQFDNTANSKATFTLKEGVLKSITGELGKIAPKNVKVKTNSGTISIEGNIYVVRQSEKQTTLATISGKTTFIDNKTNATHVVSEDRQLVRDNKGKIKVRSVDQRTIRLGKKMIRSPKQKGDVKETMSDSSVVVQSSEGTLSTENVDESIMASIDTSVASEQSTRKVAVQTSSMFSYGYWESGGIPTLGFHEGIEATASMLNTYASYTTALWGYYSGSVVTARDGVTATNGNFNLSADFQNYLVSGSISFNDSQNEYWGANINSTSIVNGSFTSSAATLTSFGTVSLDGTTSKLEGTFYGTGIDKPILNQDGVAGSFTFKDTTGTKTVTGSFGGTVYSTAGGI